MKKTAFSFSECWQPETHSIAHLVILMDALASLLSGALVMTWLVVAGMLALKPLAQELRKSA